MRCQFRGRCPARSEGEKFQLLQAAFWVLNRVLLSRATTIDKGVEDEREEEQDVQQRAEHEGEFSCCLVAPGARYTDIVEVHETSRDT